MAQVVTPKFLKNLTAVLDVDAAILTEIVDLDWILSLNVIFTLISMAINLKSYLRTLIRTLQPDLHRIEFVTMHLFLIMCLLISQTVVDDAGKLKIHHGKLRITSVTKNPRLITLTAVLVNLSFS